MIKTAYFAIFPLMAGLALAPAGRAAEWDPRMDFNGDGVVNHLDLLLFMNAWQTVNPEGFTPDDPAAASYIGVWAGSVQGTAGLEPIDPRILYIILEIRLNQQNQPVLSFPGDEDDYTLSNVSAGGFTAVSPEGERLEFTGSVQGALAGSITVTGDDGDTDTYAVNLSPAAEIPFDPSGVWIVDTVEEHNVFGFPFREVFFAEIRAGNTGTFPEASAVVNLETGETDPAFIASDIMVGAFGDNEFNLRFTSPNALTGVSEYDEDDGFPSWSTLTGVKYVPGSDANLAGAWTLTLTPLFGGGEAQTIPGVVLSQNGHRITASLPDGSAAQGAIYGNRFTLNSEIAEPGESGTVRISGAVNGNAVSAFSLEDFDDGTYYYQIRGVKTQ